MNSIFNSEDSRQILERFEKLTPDSPALWGKMNAAQMVTHCQKPLDVAEGKIIISGGLIGFLFGKMAKNSFLKNSGFSKNSPTASVFKVTDARDFDKEMQTLKSIVERFADQGPSVITNKKHPFFGVMTDDEWGALHYIHLDHHLKQFGF